MLIRKKLTALLAMLLAVGTITAFRTEIIAEDDSSETETQEMYRLYIPNSGEHFYTADVDERNYLDSLGWTTRASPGSHRLKAIVLYTAAGSA